LHLPLFSSKSNGEMNGLLPEVLAASSPVGETGDGVNY